MTTAPSPAFPAPQIFQFRLAALFVVMSWTGLISLGLRAPNAWTAAAIGIITWLIVLASILLAIYRRGRTRAAALGFAIFAGAFLIAGGLPSYGGWMSAPAGQLGTLIELLFNSTEPSALFSNPFIRPDASHLEPVCSYAVCTALGIAGSLLAQFLYATQPSHAAASDQ